jgi:hypothetical protein
MQIGTRREKLDDETLVAKSGRCGCVGVERAWEEETWKRRADLGEEVF